MYLTSGQHHCSSTNNWGSSGQNTAARACVSIWTSNLVAPSVSIWTLTVYYMQSTAAISGRITWPERVLPKRQREIIFQLRYLFNPHGHGHRRLIVACFRLVLWFYPHASQNKYTKTAQPEHAPAGILHKQTHALTKTPHALIWKVGNYYC
jgi:hypothetical protein